MEKKLDLRIEKTYLLLHNAFTALLEEKRFEEITINELCDRAMIRRTTFYKHFADKYEYFSFYLNELCDQFRSQMPPDVRNKDFSTCFLFMNKELLAFLHQHERLVRNLVSSNLFPLLSEILSQKLSTDITDLLRRCATPGLHRVSPALLEHIADFYTGGLIMMILRELKKGTPVDEAEYLEIINCLTRNINQAVAELAQG